MKVRLISPANLELDEAVQYYDHQMDNKKISQSRRKLLVLLLIFAAGMMSTAVLAGSLEPEYVTKTYTKAEKTCKQMERDHAKMKGEHEMMFRAWQEKSAPLLTEDQEVLAKCKTTLEALTEISEMIINDTLKETIDSDYENLIGIMKEITSRHKTLREEHERLFHGMMGH